MKKVISATVVLLLAAVISTAWASEKQKTIVGKKGDMMLSEPTRFGEVVLPAGHYQIEHRMAGTDHFIHLTGLKMFREDHSHGQVVKAEHLYPEVLCSTEPLKQKAPATAVYTDVRDGERRITRIEVRGETVAHVF